MRRNARWLLSPTRARKKRLPGFRRFSGVDSRKPINLSLATSAATGDLDLKPSSIMTVEYGDNTP